MIKSKGDCFLGAWMEGVEGQYGHTPPLLFFPLYGYRNRPAINRKCTAWAVLVGTGAGKSILISGQSVCSMLHFIVHNI